MTRHAHVLVIYKRSTYQRFRGGQSKRIEELIRAGDRSVEHMLEEHEAHMDTRERARKALRALGADAVFCHHYDPGEDDGWDLVVTLGGDGTLLWTSHMVGPDTPVVAINSSPESSKGYFCAGDRHDVYGTLRDALGGKLKTSRLTRMKVEVDEEVVSTRVLNDVLFSHECPAATTRYVLRVPGGQEEQMSSGVWAGPAAGSTAAQHSAGGRVLPIGSRMLQYVVREPYRGVSTDYRFKKGVIREGEDLRILCKIREGRIFMDGAHKSFPIDIGTEIRLSRSEETLTILGLHQRA